MAGPLFLGFDLSTQQLKALAIDSDLNVATEASVQFDNDLPEFKTQGGVHKQEDSLTVTAPTLLWVKALDLVLQRLKEKGLEFRSVACVSGTGQQHGSVYWKRGAKEILRTLKSGKSLYEQLKVGHFSPSWGSCIKICVIPPCGVGLGFCTLCFCFRTKMFHLNAPFFPLKCSVSPKKTVFLINFKDYSYKNVQVLQATTTTCTSS